MAQLKNPAILVILALAALLEGCAGSQPRCTPAPQIQGRPASCWETSGPIGVSPAGIALGGSVTFGGGNNGGNSNQGTLGDAVITGAEIGGAAGGIVGAVSKDLHVLPSAGIGAVVGAVGGAIIHAFRTPAQQAAPQQVAQAQPQNGQKMTGLRTASIPLESSDLDPGLYDRWIWKHHLGTNAEPKDCVMDKQIYERVRPKFCSYVHTLSRQGGETQEAWSKRAGEMVYKIR